MLILDDLKQCGSIHPDWKDLICIRTGKCLLDDHIGILIHINGFRELVQWGKVAEDEAARFGTSYRVIPIKENKDDYNK